MCGILGQITSKPIDQNEFRKTLLLMNHRGPDDNGVYFDKNLAFGHTRLSILDLSNQAHQPMISTHKDYTLVYNGEIYNFAEIKRELEEKGHSFHSHSDTEVILNGFIEYQEEIVNKLNGMFAFAIYNKNNNDVFLARDRSGIKPLYYYNKENDFSFSSEIKALKCFSSKINLEAKILFLLLGSVPEPMTIYENILMFPAGHYAYYSNGKLKTTRFSEYQYETKITRPYHEIVQDVSDLLHKSIKRHLISDAPIGTFLSGGLDSSAITAIAAQYRDNLQTLSLVFEEKNLSEEYYQNLLVKRYNTDHTSFLVDESIFLASIEEFMASFDQPSIDGLNTFFVAKAARESGLKTVLSGVGGDEIFYGYPSFKNAKTLNFLAKLPSFIIRGLQIPHKYKKLELLHIENELASYLPTRGIFSPTEIAGFLGVDIDFVYKTIARLWEEYNSSHIKALDDKVSFFELNLYMKNQLLRDTDTFGMANSLEIRVPFLDKELVDYVLKIKPEEKYARNINKIILADASRSLVPNEVINRPKMGFTLPFEYWFRKNIHKFDLDDNIKNKFLNKQLHWSRVWALLILSRYDEKL
ncbi:MAG: asparagine synthase (glutamine-hydrolyzing) [Methyloprofundus sp.]|nr:asparagine synthase (glutamine-hydrolyzing) [Methyloprofundus sp.]